MQYAEPKTRPTKPRLKLLDILGPIGGAVIGFTIFLILTTVPKYGFVPVDAILLGPGMWTLRIFYYMEIVKTKAFLEIIVFGVSSVPFIVIGFLIGSSNVYLRGAGIILLVLYGLILIIGSPLWLFAWSS